MLSSIRAETLRTVSGFAFLGVVAFGVGIPVFLLNTVLSMKLLDGLGDAAASERVFSLSTALIVVAMFAGAFSVTREYYYSSMGRTLIAVGFRRAFWSKALGSAVSSAGLSAVMCVVWFAISAAVIAHESKTFVPTTVMLTSAAGTIAASAIAAVIGNGVGWAVHNYYVACLVVLVAPLALELPLLATRPEIGRYSPSGSLAGLSGAAGLDALTPLCGLGIAIVWAGGATALGYFAARNREA